MILVTIMTEMDDYCNCILIFLESDNIFVDSDGISNSISRRMCLTLMLYVHIVWYLETFYAHAKNSSGGCTITTYTCQRCEKCGYRANAKYYSHNNICKMPSLIK